jgi:carboxymethylenebutenolidase
MEITQPLGYLATPENGSGIGLLVLHPWWGLNDTMKSVCKRLADKGYTVFAPDLYLGKIAATIEAAEALSQELNEEQAKVDISNAVEFLSGLDAVTRPELGVIGFSLGAYYALGLSVDDPQRVRAVVLFYGTGEGDFAKSRSAYLGHFAQTDEYEPESFVQNVEQALRAAGRPVTFYIYENTGHWFFEPDRPDAYNPAAAQLAWERTLAFLKDSLSI